MTQPPIPSRVAIRGHPVHPMLVHFPVAALLGLVASDAGYLYTGDAFWARASLWLSGVGALGGWVASLAGLLDLLWVARIRRLVTAWCHGVLAVMLLSLATLNWLARLDGMIDAILPWGLYLSLLTAGFIAATALLGGQLVYEQAVGVETDPGGARAGSAGADAKVLEPHG